MQAIVLNELVHFNSENVQLFEDIKFSSGVCTLLFDAIKFGNTEFLIKLIRSYPNIIWKKDNETQSLFHMAVINRQESVLNLLYETVAVKEIIIAYVDDSKQNILHLAGKLAPPSRLNIVTGAALQMQRELLWFKVSVYIISISISCCTCQYTLKTVGGRKDCASISEHGESC